MKPSLQYWLHWEVGLCFLSVLACVGVSVYLVWRYEGTRAHRGTEAAQPGAEGGERSPGVVYDGEAWRPYLQNVHPCWLLAYRIASFLFFTVFTVIIVKLRSHTIFYYYTEWTFLLVALYFGLATSLSVYGCTKNAGSHASNGEDPGQIAGFGGYLLQITYQTCAGAVMLTDSCFGAFFSRASSSDITI